MRKTSSPQKAESSSDLRRSVRMYALSSRPGPAQPIFCLPSADSVRSIVSSNCWPDPAAMVTGTAALYCVPSGALYCPSFP